MSKAKAPRICKSEGCTTELCKQNKRGYCKPCATPRFAVDVTNNERSREKYISVVHACYKRRKGARA